jgi:hypothetical protein
VRAQVDVRHLRCEVADEQAVQPAASPRFQVGGGEFPEGLRGAGFAGPVRPVVQVDDPAGVVGEGGVDEPAERFGVALVGPVDGDRPGEDQPRRFRWRGGEGAAFGGFHFVQPRQGCGPGPVEHEVDLLPQQGTADRVRFLMLGPFGEPP